MNKFGPFIVQKGSILDLEEAAVKLKQLTGHSIFELVDMFAEGYTLQPPEPPKSMKDLSEELDM